MVLHRQVPQPVHGFRILRNRSLFICFILPVQGIKALEKRFPETEQVNLALCFF